MDRSLPHDNQETRFLGIDPRHWLLGLILLSALFPRIIYMNRAFARDAEGTASFYPILARNYFDPALQTRLLAPVVGKSTPDDRLVLYANHPPTIVWEIAATYYLCGYRGGADAIPPDWQARLPAVPFVIGCVLAIYFIVRQRDPSRTRPALIAAALFAAVPITQRFGGHPDVINPQLIFFALLTIASYLRLLDRPTIGRTMWTVGAFALAAATDWPAFLLVPLLGAHFMLMRPWREWWIIAVFGICAGAMFGGLYAYSAAALSDWHWMVDKVARRVSSNSETLGKFTLSVWLGHAIAGHAFQQITPVLLVGMVVWFISQPLRNRGRAERFALLLIGWAALHVGVGRQGVYQHAWWWWPVAPAAAVATALLVERILLRFELPRVGHGVAAAGLLLFFAFSAWRTNTEFARVYDMTEVKPTYTIKEIGQAIQRTALPGTPIAVAEGDQSVSLWHYGNRSIVRVWTPDDVRAALRPAADGVTVELPLGFVAHSAAAPTGLLLPRGYRSYIPELFDYAAKNLKSIALAPDLDDRFLAYDLREIATTQPSSDSMISRN